MKLLAAAALWLPAFACGAQALEIQRALIQRDQQSAEFAAQVRGAPDLGRLQQLHAAQLRDASLPIHPESLMPYQRERMAQDREFLLPPPVVRVKPAEKALPLPGGPKHGVDPIPVQGTSP
jgi:hypothetical protein